MCLMVLFGLALNESCLEKVEPNTFWMKVIRIYLILVGIYLELLLIFLLYIVYLGCKEDFFVRNYEPENIEIM